MSYSRSAGGAGGAASVVTVTRDRAAQREFARRVLSWRGIVGRWWLVILVVAVGGRAVAVLLALVRQLSMSEHRGRAATETRLPA